MTRRASRGQNHCWTVSGTIKSWHDEEYSSVSQVLLIEYRVYIIEKGR